MKKREILSAVIGGVIGFFGGEIVTTNTMKKGIKNWETMSKKHFSLFLLMNEWMKTKQQGKSIVDYFKKEKISTIAIYGMSYVGERIYDELKNSEIEVKYAIDKNAESIYSDITVCSPEDVLQEVDAVVVTAISFYDEIRDMLSEKMSCPIISFEDILYEI